MNSKVKTLAAIKAHAKDLQKILDGHKLNLKADRLLAALACCESSYGANNVPRFEPAYWTGKYADKEANARYGKDAASSWSSWQIMYSNAKALGYAGEPGKLIDPETAIPWIIKFLDTRILDKGAKDLRDIADAYNSGSFRDRVIPHEYIDKCEVSYHSSSTDLFLAGEL